MNVELFLAIVAAIIVAELIVWFPALGLINALFAAVLFQYDGFRVGTLMAVVASGWLLFAVARYGGSIWPRSNKKD